MGRGCNPRSNMGEEPIEQTAVPTQEQKVIGVNLVHNHHSNEAVQQASCQLHTLAESGRLRSQKKRAAYKGLLSAKCVCVCLRESEREKRLCYSHAEKGIRCWLPHLKNRVCCCQCNNFITACSGTWWRCSLCAPCREICWGFPSKHCVLCPQHILYIMAGFPWDKIFLFQLYYPRNTPAPLCNQHHLYRRVNSYTFTWHGRC